MLAPSYITFTSTCTFFPSLVAFAHSFSSFLYVLRFTEEADKKWSPHYPAVVQRWYDHWDVITPIFKFSMGVRTAFYTTNIIESLNASYRRLNRQRSVFPSAQVLLKILYLATYEATKKWSMPIKNWGKIRGELVIMYPGRLPD